MSDDWIDPSGGRSRVHQVREHRRSLGHRSTAASRAAPGITTTYAAAIHVARMSANDRSIQHQPDDGGRGRGERELEEEVRQLSAFGLGQEELPIADELVAIRPDVAEAERESSGPVGYSADRYANTTPGPSGTRTRALTRA